MKRNKLLRSFKHAGDGIATAFIGERNFRIHCIVALIVIILGLVLQLSFLKWTLTILAMGAVFVAELFNTAAETLVDMITTEYSENAKKVKDLSAAAVMVTSFAAIMAGLYVFLEPLINLFRSLM